MEKFKRIIEFEEGVALPYVWKMFSGDTLLAEGRTITEDMAEDMCDLQEEILSFYEV